MRISVVKKGRGAGTVQTPGPARETFLGKSRGNGPEGATRITLGGVRVTMRGRERILGAGKGVCRASKVRWKLVHQRGREKSGGSRRGGRAQAAAAKVPIPAPLRRGPGASYSTRLGFGFLIWKGGS